MPRVSLISPATVAEVAQRRAAGEPWKVILADMRSRGLPADRSYWWERVRDVGQHHDACADGGAPCTASA